MKFFRKSPFFRLLFLYASGLWVAGHVEICREFILVLIIAAVILTVFIMLPFMIFRNYQLNIIFGIIMSVVLFLSGLIHSGLKRTAENHILSENVKEGIFQARILERPEMRSKTVKVLVRVTGEINNDTIVLKDFKAVLYVEKDSSAVTLVPGAELVFYASLDPVWLPGNPGEFSYRKYLSNRKIYLQAYLQSDYWEVSPKKPVRGLKTIAGSFRDKLLDQYRKLNLGPVEYGALSALTLGYRLDLDAQTRNIFTRAGVMHIMALSGFHTGVVALLLGYIFGLFNGSISGKITKVIATILMLWVFAFVTGLSASVTRATVMLSLFILGKLIGKNIQVYNILFASAFAMLAVSPGLISDVSFQLSFLAVSGIVLFQPLIERIIRIRARIPDKIWKMFTVSCAAQIATLPVTLYYFHQFPVYFWLANLFVVPMVAIIIYLSVFYLVFSCINPLGWIFGKAIAGTVSFLLDGVALVEKLPYALIDGIGISKCQVVLMFIVILLVGLSISYRRIKLFLACLVGILAFLVLDTWQDYRLSRQKLLIVNNLNGISSINLISGNSSLLLVDPDSLMTQANLTYSFYNFWIDRKVFNDTLIFDCDDDEIADSLYFPGLYVKQHFLGKNVFMHFYGKNMVVFRGIDNGKYGTTQRLPVDMGIVTGFMYPDLEEILQLFNMKLLIIDSSVSYDRAKKWIEACSEKGINCWDVRSHGAYFTELGIPDS